MPLQKSKQFLKAAELLWEAGLVDACASRCYYTMFWAAIAMLDWAGVRRDTWSHEGLRRQFSYEMVVKRQRAPTALGEALRVAYDLRCVADYERISVPRKKTKRMLTKAQQFVELAQEVIQ